MGTLSVLNAILKSRLMGRTRLVFASSSAVCGDASVLPTPEAYPSNPQSPYALAKLHGEQWCDIFHRLYGLDVVSLRYFNVFGPGGLFGGAYSTVLSAWSYHLFVDPSYQPFLEGDGTQTRDFCFVENVVQANIAALTRERGFAADVLNVGQGEAHSMLEVKDVLEQVAGRELPLERRPPASATSHIPWPTSPGPGRNSGSSRRPTFTPRSNARRYGTAIVIPNGCQRARVSRRENRAGTGRGSFCPNRLEAVP